MPEMVYNMFVYLLAVYGAIALIISIIESISKNIKEGISGMRLILQVKNQQEYIEGVVRNLCSGNVLGKVVPVKTITVLDMGSSDDTLKILKLLNRDFNCLEIIERDEKEKIFEGFDEENFPSTVK